MRRTYLQSETERIRQLRLNLLVHSYIYYELDTNIISDHQWQAIADELVERQAEAHPIIGCYDEAFRAWNGSTGFHLPKDAWVISKAQYLLRLTGNAQQQPHPPKRVTLIEDRPKRTGLLF